MKKYLIAGLVLAVGAYASQIRITKRATEVTGWRTSRDTYMSCGNNGRCAYCKEDESMPAFVAIDKCNRVVFE